MLKFSSPKVDNQVLAPWSGVEQLLTGVGNRPRACVCALFNIFKLMIVPHGDCDVKVSVSDADDDQTAPGSASRSELVSLTLLTFGHKQNVQINLCLMHYVLIVRTYVCTYVLFCMQNSGVTIIL